MVSRSRPLVSLHNVETENAMKKFSMLAIAVLTLAVTLSISDTNARTRAYDIGNFPIMLGVGY